MKNKRLQAIVNLIPENSIVADIGTDHGYLPCELIQKNIAIKCYACDIAKMPLESAKETIERSNLQNQIETILCPGIELVPNDANVVVIAGMGWVSAKSILENDFDKLSQFDLVIVQVNREVENLRKWIDHHQFHIEYEEVVLDRLYYQIVAFSPKKQAKHRLTRYEIEFGPLLIHKKNDAMRSYFEHILNRNQELLSKIGEDSEKSKEVKSKIEFLKKL